MITGDALTGSSTPPICAAALMCQRAPTRPDAPPPGVRIDHRARADVRADVHEHRRHADDTGRDVHAPPDRRAARHDPHAVLETEALRWNGVLVHERERVAARREVRQLAEAERDENPALHPRHRAPGAIVSSNSRTHRARLECLEQLVDDAPRVARRLGSLRKREQLVQTRLERADSDSRETHLASAPASTRLARSFASCFASIGTSGSRSWFWCRPIIASAAFTGIGFDSQNAVCMNACNWRCSARAASISPSSARRQRSAMLRGTAFDTTDTTPCPPAAMTPSVMESSAESTLKPLGAWRITSEICAGLPDASFTATMFGCSASASVVSASMLLAVRPGTLYTTTGSGDASAIARKCARIPR